MMMNKASSQKRWRSCRDEVYFQAQAWTTMNQSSANMRNVVLEAQVATPSCELLVRCPISMPMHYALQPVLFYCTIFFVSSIPKLPSKKDKKARESTTNEALDYQCCIARGL